MLVDFSGGTVFYEEATEDSETAHPDDLANGVDDVLATTA